MKSYIYLISVFILGALCSTLLFVSCNDSDDTDSAYLYLPYELSSTDVFYYTTRYIYNNNRPTEIHLLEKINTVTITDSTHISITYNADGNPTDMEVSAGYLRQDTLGNSLFETYRYTFSYQGENVIIDRDNTPFLCIELNGKGQAVKCTDRQSLTSLAYEYHENGNIRKITDNEGTEYTYQYDNKRGIFREVNLPQWFINAMFSVPLDILDLKAGQFLNIRNNCTSITVNNGNEGVNNTFTYSYTYSGFRYPTLITDGNNTQMRVRYQPVQ